MTDATAAVELRRLVDRAAIHDALVRLALAQDARDWDALADCYAPDATYRHPGGELVGVGDIVGRTSTALAPLDACQHLLGSILVTLDDTDPDAASSTTYFQAQHVRRGLPGGEHLIIAGTYRDRFRRGPDGRWRIVHRTQEYSWRAGNPEVTRRTPPTERPPEEPT